MLAARDVERRAPPLVGVAGEREVVALTRHPALDEADADPRIEPAMESEERGRHRLRPSVEPEKPKSGAHELRARRHHSAASRISATTASRFFCSRMARAERRSALSRVGQCPG
jgi:hypothetical protein